MSTSDHESSSDSDNERMSEILEPIQTGTNEWGPIQL